MEWGDIDGAVTELIITCYAIEDLVKGDLVSLGGGNYHVHKTQMGGHILGQSMADVQNGMNVPIKVRGIIVARASGLEDIEPDGMFGVRVGQDGGIYPCFGGQGVYLAYYTNDNFRKQNEIHFLL